MGKPDRNGWWLLTEAATHSFFHLFKADLWVPGQGRVTDCTFSHAFSPPRWNEQRRDHPDACQEVRGASHYRLIPGPPESYGR